MITWRSAGKEAPESLFEAGARVGSKCFAPRTFRDSPAQWLIRPEEWALLPIHGCERGPRATTSDEVFFWFLSASSCPCSFPPKGCRICTCHLTSLSSSIDLLIRLRLSHNRLSRYVLPCLFWLIDTLHSLIHWESDWLIDTVIDHCFKLPSSSRLKAVAESLSEFLHLAFSLMAAWNEFSLLTCLASLAHLLSRWQSPRLSVVSGEGFVSLEFLSPVSRR